MEIPSTRAPKHRIGMSIVCLHVSAALYLIVGLAMFPLFSMDDEMGSAGPLIAVLMFAFCLALIVGIEFVVWGLKKRRYWAWIVGIVIFGIYLPSLYLVLGALGMWGLLDESSRAQFRQGSGPVPPLPLSHPPSQWANRSQSM
jgi:hypothetical protein